MNLDKILSPAALSNVNKTGNVWGTTTEYDFKFEIRLFRRRWAFEQRKASNFMGRFGGGWGIKLGLQAGSLKSLLTLSDVIVSLFTLSIRIRK